MKFTLVLLLAVAYTQAVQYNAVPDEDAKKKTEFDGVGIGLVTRPKVCDKTTAKGDLLRVNFNASIGDGTVFESRWDILWHYFSWIKLGIKYLIVSFANWIEDEKEAKQKQEKLL